MKRPFWFVVFNYHMAASAKTNQVSKAVCFFVTGEVCKSLDVVNFQSFTDLFFGYTTTLASMIVSGSGKAFLPLPICAIVGGGATSPRRAILAAPIVRFPLCKTFVVAIESLFLFACRSINQFIRLTFQCCTAPVTRNFHRWHPARRFFSNAHSQTFCRAFIATVVFFLDLRRFATKYLAASRADHIDSVVLMVTVATLIFQQPLRFTFYIAKLLFGACYPILLANNFCSAFGTLYGLASCSGNYSASIAASVNLCSFYKSWYSLKFFLAYCTGEFHICIIPATRLNGKQYGSDTIGVVALNHMFLETVT